MRPLAELINTEEPGWDLVLDWINSGSNKVEILPADPEAAADALYRIQVTTRSPMGAIIYSTGGIIIDDGWIRILGSGSENMKRSLPDWNLGKTYTETGETPGFLLIADDAIGGFFVLNGGALSDDPGKVYYFAPDSLNFEPLDISYSEFLLFCFNHDLDTWYDGYRWDGWKKEIENMSADHCIDIYPPLWTKEGKDFSKHSRKPVPAEESYDLHLYQREQLEKAASNNK